MMYLVVLMVAVLVLGGATVLPTWYYKYCDPAIIRRVPCEGAVLLTFDDGPDLTVTEPLLDLLKEQQVCATFFVVGEKAQKEPALIRRMLAEGHSVGFHSYRHQNPWRGGLRQDLARCCEFAATYDLPITTYRPPWGRFGWGGPQIVRAAGLTPVLWNVMAEDWEQAATWQQLEQKLLNRVRSGSIICLHDGSGEGEHEAASAQMLLALAQAIPKLRAQGLRFCSLQEVL